MVPEHLWWDGSDRGKGFRIYCYDEDGPSIYFALLHEPVDQEWVRKNWGGGTYKFNLNDVENKFKASTKFRIEGESKRRKAVTNAQNAPIAASSNDAVLGQILEAMREDQRQMRDMLREAMNRGNLAPVAMAPQVDPTAIFKGMLEMFKEIMPKQDAKDPFAMMMQLKQLMGEPRDILSDLAKLKEAGLIGGNSGGSGNLMKELETIMAVAEKMGLQAGSGKGWAEILIEKGPEIAQHVRAIVGDYKEVEEKRAETANRVLKIQENAKQGPAANPAQLIPQPRAAVTHAQPGSAQHGPAQHGPAPANVPQPQAQPSLDVEPIAEQTAGEVLAQMTEAQVDFIKRRIVDLMMRGTTGSSIVAWLDVEAPILVGGFENVPEGQLVQFFGMDPILNQATVHPRFRVCVHEIVEALNDVEEEDLPAHGPN